MIRVPTYIYCSIGTCSDSHSDVHVLCAGGSCRCRPATARSCGSTNIACSHGGVYGCVCVCMCVCVCVRVCVFVYVRARMWFSSRCACTGRPTTYNVWHWCTQSQHSVFFFIGLPRPCMCSAVWMNCCDLMRTLYLLCAHAAI
jgi:hypothetical protein